MPDYIPRSDDEFDTWQAAFLTYAGGNTAALGLEAADLTPITTAQTAWDTALASHATAQNDARAAREGKDAKRKALEDSIRALVRRLQVSPDVSDEERQSLGITVADTTRSASTTMATRPRATVDATRLRHTIAFYEESTPSRRAKPDGVSGCEIWVKIGDPAPTDGSQCQFLALDSATPYVADYDGANGGKTAHYMLRWVTKGGEKLAWSETVSETIRA